MSEQGTEERPKELKLHSYCLTHKLHSTEAPHSQSADSVEVAQRHAGEEVGLHLQSAVRIKKKGDGKTE